MLLIFRTLSTTLATPHSAPDDSCNVEVERFGEPKVLPEFLNSPYHTQIMESFANLACDMGRRGAGVSRAGFSLPARRHRAPARVAVLA